MVLKRLRDTWSGGIEGETGYWSSGYVFALAVAGAAIGFNNFWQFPALIDKYGGGAFLLFYLLALMLIGIPLLVAEMAIGRRGAGSPVRAIKRLVEEDGARPAWRVLGWVVTLTGFLIFSYLSVVGSWSLAYMVRASAGMFQNTTMGGMLNMFYAFAADPEKQLFWHGLFVVAAVVVTARGVNRGLEPAARIGLPIIIGGLILLVVYAAMHGHILDALINIFRIDYMRITLLGVTHAMMHALFSLGLGVGAVIAYSAYLQREVSIMRAAASVVLIDTVVGLLAALLTFLLVKEAGQQLATGPVLLLQVMPYTLSRLTGGDLAAALLFIVLAVSAMLTAVALLEPVVRALQEHRAMPRARAAALAGFMAWLLGVVVILSFNHWAFDFEIFGIEKRLGIFDIIEMMTSNVLLPLGSLFVAIFNGWVLERAAQRHAVRAHYQILFRVWLRLIRVVVPVLLIILSVAVFRLYR